MVTSTACFVIPNISYLLVTSQYFENRNWVKELIFITQELCNGYLQILKPL